MSDPLSPVASVAGVVGFGLTICTGVMAYLDAINSRSQEIEHAKQEAQTMRQLLTTIDNSIKKTSLSHASSTSAVRACMETCNREIAALEALVAGLQVSTVVGQDNRVWSNMKEHGKKLTYALNRPKLDRLQAQLAKVTVKLQVALQVLGM